MNRYLPHHLPPLLAVQLIPMDTLFALLVVLLVVFFAHSGGLAFMLNSPRGPSAREAACVPKVFSRLSGGNCNENLNVRINVRTSRCLALHDSCPAKADSVGTVTFADVPSNCGFAVGPCTGMV